jgi:hypothetical protein
MHTWRSTAFLRAVRGVLPRSLPGVLKTSRLCLCKCQHRARALAYQTRLTACRWPSCRTCARSAIPARCAQSSQNPPVPATQACSTGGAPRGSIRQTRRWVPCCVQPCRMWRWVGGCNGVLQTRRAEGSRGPGEGIGRSGLPRHVDL